MKRVVQIGTTQAGSNLLTNDVKIAIIYYMSATKNKKFNLGTTRVEEKPASKDALNKVHTLLKAFEQLPEVVPVLEENSTIEALSVESHAPIGVKWSTGDHSDKTSLRVEVTVYEKELRKMIGQELAEATHIPDVSVHGSISFRQQLEDSVFGGWVLFLGDSEDIHSILVLSDYKRGSDEGNKFKLLQSADTIGLRDLYLDANNSDLQELEHRVWANHNLSTRIAGGLENLYSIASAETATK